MIRCHLCAHKVYSSKMFDITANSGRCPFVHIALRSRCPQSATSTLEDDVPCPIGHSLIVWVPVPGILCPVVGKFIISLTSVLSFQEQCSSNRRLICTQNVLGPMATMYRWDTGFSVRWLVTYQVPPLQRSPQLWPFRPLGLLVEGCLTVHLITHTPDTTNKPIWKISTGEATVCGTRERRNNINTQWLLRWNKRRWVLLVGSEWYVHYFEWNSIWLCLRCGSHIIVYSYYCACFLHSSSKEINAFCHSPYSRWNGSLFEMLLRLSLITTVPTVMSYRLLSSSPALHQTLCNNRSRRWLACSYQRFHNGGKAKQYQRLHSSLVGCLWFCSDHATIRT
jgi:hypothetical protein